MSVHVSAPCLEASHRTQYGGQHSSSRLGLATSASPKLCLTPTPPSHLSMQTSSSCFPSAKTLRPLSDHLVMQLLRFQGVSPLFTLESGSCWNLIPYFTRNGGPSTRLRNVMIISYLLILNAGSYVNTASQSLPCSILSASGFTAPGHN